jgi:hypothetical protein
LIHYRPVDDTVAVSSNQSEIFAEAMIFALHYIMLEFTDFVVIKDNNRGNLNAFLNGCTVTLTMLLMVVEFMPIVIRGICLSVKSIKAKVYKCIDDRRTRKKAQESLNISSP